MALPRAVLIIVILNSLVLIGSTGLNFYLLGEARSGAALAGTESAEKAAPPQASSKDYQFFPVERIIVNLRGDQRERYFVLDLALQADVKVPGSRLEQLEPVVRNSVIASLSAMEFEVLRNLPISDLQRQLEDALKADLDARQLAHPIEHVLISKMIVQ